MELRLYQKDAVEAVYNHLREKDNNPCVVIPTGGGKTPVLATIIRDAIVRWDGRVLLLTHVKELLLQAEEKLRMIAGDIDMGIYSAGLRRRELDHKCILAGIQSVYKRAKELGFFNLVIIDEVHMVPNEGHGRYRTLLADLKEINPSLRIIGLTATPYRTTTGMICTEDGILNEICYEISVKTLIEQHYLCPLRTRVAENEVQTDGIAIRNGEFEADEMEHTMREGDNVERACSEILHVTRDRHSVLVFCAGIAHAEDVMRELRKSGARTEGVFGDTLPAFRAQYIQEFKDGKIKFLVNVGVFTTGFDAPNIDAVAMLRPTCSPGLYYQMIGRGLRLSDTKENCLVLDFAGNAMRHGPIDMLAPAAKEGKEREVKPKMCPQCRTVVPPRTMLCPECGFAWEPAPPIEPSHNAKFDPSAPILSGMREDTVYEVHGMDFYEHRKRNSPDAPPTVRVDYHIDMLTNFSEWLCPEHTGYARTKFERWWAKHAPGCPPPQTVKDTIFLANEGAVSMPKTIKVRTESGKKFPEIIGCTLEPRPAPATDEELAALPF